MAIQTTNPFTNQVEMTFTELTDAEIQQALGRAQQAFFEWRRTSLEERAELMRRVAAGLRDRATPLARLATLEMGKLLSEARDWEVQICADIADYYARNAESFLARRHIELPDGRAYVDREPIGMLLGVMPWNFPFYQVFRFVVPNLMAGNVCLVKHASNVPQCGIALEEVFRQAGFPDGAYTNLLISASKVSGIIDDKRIRGVSLTGSEAAGSRVAERAGRQLKKAVMELGGSDPFIVLEDADLPRAVEVAMAGKMFNCGQCCAAAKRFVLVGKVAEPFVEMLSERMAMLRPGDPMLATTGLAPMVSEAQANEVLGLVQESVAKGAKIRLGGDRPGRPGAFMSPTVLTDVTPGMPAYHREIFGPVATVLRARDEEDAIRLANDSEFGLGAVICSRDKERAARLASRLETGMVYVNTHVISQPELPFGGVKNSGFGRELSSLGIEEFLNHKLVRVLD